MLKSYRIRIGRFRIKEVNGYWGAYDENSGELVYGGKQNSGGVDGEQFLEVIRVVFNVVTSGD